MLIGAAVKFAKDMNLTSRMKQEVAPVLCAIELTRNGYMGLSNLSSKVKDRDKAAQVWVPKRSGRTSGIKAEFVVDKAEYTLSLVDEGGKRFRAFCEVVQQAAIITDDEALKVFDAFLHSPDLKKCQQEYLSMFPEATGNILVRYEGEALHERPAVLAYWQNQEKDVLKIEAQCASCRERKHPVRLHAKISGGSVRGSLVSFNTDTAESYGHKKAETFPVCPECAEAYTLAIQRLLKDGFPDPKTCEPLPRRSYSLSPDTVALWWVDTPNGCRDDFDLRLVYEGGDLTALPDLNADSWLHYAEIAQLSTGRLSIREYMQKPVLEIIKAVHTYREVLEIVGLHPEWEKQPYTFWWYQRALTGKSAQKLPPSFVRDMSRCMFNEQAKFPVWILYHALNRSKRNRGITAALASLIRGVLNRNFIEPRYTTTEEKERNRVPVRLNPEHPSGAYQFGRYFALAEFLHRRAFPDVNKTLSDTFWVTASTRPSVVRLRLKHKIDVSLNKKRFLTGYQKVATEIFEHIEGLPTTFTPEQQGLFMEGYYHQRAVFYTPKQTEEQTAPEEN